MKPIVGVSTLALFLIAGLPAAAQQALTPLELEVVISRYQGEKRISSVPYLLAVNAANDIGRAVETMLNMGTEVPVPTAAFTPVTPQDKEKAGEPPFNPLRSYNYRSVGTNITASAATSAEGRFEIRLFIDDTSIYRTDSKDGGFVADMPVFRSFRSRNTLLLRDGQARQYTAATDRVSGEVVRVDVTLRVLK